MDEKQHFRNCCKELGIDCDTYIKLGAGNPKNPTRFIFQSDHTKRKDTQLFAVKYFEQEDVYIAWNLKERGGSGKNSFSLSKNKIKELKAEQVLAKVWVILTGIEKPYLLSNPMLYFAF